MKAEIFSNKGMKVFCDTYLCRTPAQYFVGSPKGPLMLLMNLCQDCRDSILNTLIDQDRQGLSKRIEELEASDRINKEKKEHGGKEFPCKHCGEIYWSPRSLGAHVKMCPEKKKDGEA